MKNNWIIGVCGGSASGKTTIVNRISNHFGSDILVINHDSYYNEHNDMTYEERSKLNYDHPSSFETERLVRDLNSLLNGEEVDVPVYDFSIHNRSSEVTHVMPKKIIVVEGIMVLENKVLRDMMDIKVYVDTDADERLMRRIRRDMEERARTIDSILTQYAQTVKPMHEEFIEPSKRYADIIIPRGGENEAGIGMMISYMDHLLSGEF
ncbi:MAG: uridine kinase [Lachnospiraceae bacterium]|jgi:uridine kinase|nr:uridine kinase [Lachnospiraceae bacterium]